MAPGVATMLVRTPSPVSLTSQDLECCVELLDVLYGPAQEVVWNGLCQILFFSSSRLVARFFAFPQPLSLRQLVLSCLPM